MKSIFPTIPMSLIPIGRNFTYWHFSINITHSVNSATEILKNTIHMVQLRYLECTWLHRQQTIHDFLAVFAQSLKPFAKHVDPSVSPKNFTGGDDVKWKLRFIWTIQKCGQNEIYIDTVSAFWGWGARKCSVHRHRTWCHFVFHLQHSKLMVNRVSTPNWISHSSGIWQNEPLSTFKYSVWPIMSSNLRTPNRLIYSRTSSAIMNR